MGKHSRPGEDWVKVREFDGPHIRYRSVPYDQGGWLLPPEPVLTPEHAEVLRRHIPGAFSAVKIKD